MPNAAAAVTTQGVLAVVGVPTTAGAAFPLPAGTNNVRWALGAPRFPGTYYVRVTLQFDSTLLGSVNGPILNSEATGSDADGSNGGKDNVFRYYQPAATTTANSALYVTKDIVAVNGVTSLNPTTVPPGAKLTYRIRYMNTAGLPQTNVVISDTVPAQISTVCASITNLAGNATAASNTCPVAGSTITFNVNNKLNVGQGGVVTFDMQTVSSANLTVTNTAKIVSTQNATGVTSANSTLLQMPDLTITKSHASSFYQGLVGAQYTITASNVGNYNTAGLVTVTDTVPAGLVATAASGTGWSCLVGATTTCTRSDSLAASSSYPPITLTVDVDPAAAASVTNSVTVSGGGETNTANNTATDPTTITAKPDLTIAKTHIGNFTQGQTNAVYTLTVTNIRATATTSAFSVVDTLPAGLSYVSATGTSFTCAASGQVVTCNRTVALNAGVSVPITLTVNVAANATTPQVNQVTVSGGGEVNLANNTATDSTIILQPRSVGKAFAATTIATNATTVMTITLTNPNPVATSLANPAFTDTYPAGLINTTSANGATTCTGGTVTAANSGNSVRLASGSIPANGSCTVTVNVTSAATGTYLNNTGAVATVGSGTGASASATLNVVAPVAPTIVKSFNPNPVSANFPSVLSITVTNPNAAAISAVAFNDPYPTSPGAMTNTATPGAGFTSASIAAGCAGTISGGGPNGTSIGLTAGVIPANTSCVIQVNVKAPVSGNYTNTTANITTTNGGVFIVGGTASSSLTVVNSVAPIVSKSFAAPSIGAGSKTKLTINISNTNTGPLTLSSIFTDTLPTTPGAMTVATPNNLGGTCTGVTANVGAAMISLASGSSIPVGGCTITVDVTASVLGAYTNTIAAGALATNAGSNAAAATANVVVLTAPTISKSFTPSTILIGDSSVLRLTITNPNSIALTGLGVTDAYPVSPPLDLKNTATPNATTTCTAAGAAVTAAANDVFVSLAGGSVPANSTCTISVNVTGSVAGNYPNTSGGASSNETGTAGPVSNTATLTIQSVILTVTKTTSTPNVINTPAGSTATYSITVSNTGTGAATGIKVIDTLPAGFNFGTTSSVSLNGSLLAPASFQAITTGAQTPGTPQWDANPSGGFTINAGQNLVITFVANLAGNVPDGTFSNSASATAASAGATITNFDGAASTAEDVIVINGVLVSGVVYADPNHNAIFNSGEAGTGKTLYVKLATLSGGVCLSPALAAATVSLTASGNYDLPGTPPGDYCLILDNNNVLSDITPTPALGWLNTEIPNGIRTLTVLSTPIANQNFGLYFGSKLSGVVFADTGISGGTANDGLQNGGELGIGGVTVKATNGGITVDSAVTDGSGNYSMWLPGSATGNVLITETNLGGYVSVAGSAGNTAGTYTRSTDVTSFSFVSGSIYLAVNFGDVPVNTFAPDGAQSALPATAVFYPHTFTAGTAGTVTFTTSNISTQNIAGWNTLIYRDTNCNGVIDVAEASAVIATNIPAVAGQLICIVVKENIPANAPYNGQDQITVNAQFIYLNAASIAVSPLVRQDLTVVGNATGTGLVLQKAVRNVTAGGVFGTSNTGKSGDVLEYMLTYINTSNGPLTNVIFNDTMPAFTVFDSANCGAPISCTIAPIPLVGTSGNIQWALSALIPAGATGTVTFRARIQ